MDGEHRGRGLYSSEVTPWVWPTWATRGFDAIALVCLTVVAWRARRGTLPTDGLWFDDSWVAAGAILGRPRSLMVVGTGHPGFTAVLMAIHRMGGDLAALGLPSLAAGIVAPAVLYLALRSVGYERSVSVLVSAALVVAPIHVLYSGRVKGYTLDTLWVIALVVALPMLARRRWHWPLAVAWVVVAVGIGTFSGYTLVATAGVALMLVLHPTSDRIVRVVAVGTQAVIQGAYFLVAQSKADLAGIQEVMDGPRYDAHLRFSWNPVTFGGQLLTHLGRVGQVFPAGPRGTNTLLAAVAVLGLVMSATLGSGRSETLVARLLLFLVVFAIVASTFGQFPFGPLNVNPVSAGGRHTLWLLPAVAFGLAAIAHRARRLVSQRDTFRLGFDALAVLAAVVIVVAGYQPALAAPGPGSVSAAAFVERSASPEDVVVVTTGSTFSYAITSATPVTIQATPDHQVGFAPVYLDPQVHNIGPWSAEQPPPSQIRRWVANADRVFVVGNGALAMPGLNQAARELEPAGFTMVRRTFGLTFVDVWTR